MTKRRSAEPAPAGPDPAARDAAGVSVGVPFRHRLGTKLLGLTAFVAIAALASVWLAETRMRRDLETQLTRSTALLSDAVQATMQHAMLEGLPDHAYDTLALMGSLEGIERLRVIDKQGRVVFSTARQDLKTRVAQEGRACAACHGGRALPLSRVAPSELSEIVGRGADRALVLTAPVYNARSCATAACHVHPPGRQVLGLFEVRVSLASLDQSVLAFRQGVVATLVATVLGVALLLYLFFRSEVLEPVAELVEGTHRVARDQLDVQIRVRSKGELGVLANSFNEMTQSLQRLEDELEVIMDGLERQVEARTADLREAQEQLVRTEKLSSLGKLSASIAHEINNPLAGILTFAKLVSRTLGEGPPDAARIPSLQKNLALIERETQRCSTIVKNLLDFARERPLQPRALDPRAPLEEALSLLENQLRTQGIAVEKDLQPVPEVVADFGQLRQAFVNIAMNACDAMGTSGTLRVSARDLGGEVELVLADTGPGIPPDRLSKIFDPFFTTKEKGTGLGLSVVYGIVHKHGGTISVASEVGRGTAFTIRLPVPATSSASAVEAGAA